jgi:hypothetical protein
VRGSYHHTRQPWGDLSYSRIIQATQLDFRRTQEAVRQSACGGSALEPHTQTSFSFQMGPNTKTRSRIASTSTFTSRIRHAYTRIVLHALSHPPRHSLRVDLPSTHPRPRDHLLVTPRLGDPPRHPATTLELSSNHPYRTCIPTTSRFWLIYGCD